MRYRAWTANDVRRLREQYPYSPNYVLATRFGRSAIAIQSTGHKLGLRKSYSPPPRRRLKPVEAEPLLNQIEVLRDRVDELEELIGVRQQFPQFGLTATEMKVLGILVQREIVSQKLIYGVLYGGDSDRQIKTIDVFISKIRRKLAPHGHEIKTSWGSGFYMDASARAALKEAARVSA